MSAPPDDLADWLAPPPPPGNRPDLRAAVLRRSGRVLLWRRCARRAGRAVLLAAVFAAGGAVVWLFAPRQVVREVQVVVEDRRDKPDGSPRDDTPSARELEDAAAQSQAHREAARRFREAGDRYAAAGDYEAALRCYKQALDAGPPADLTIDPTDNWLLMTLKADRLKEKTNADPDS